MSAYRFCRTDDMGLLVEAHSRCYAVHFPAERPLTVADFKRGARELGLWCSSCMVAFEGSEPVAVLLAAKRPHATFVHSIGVRPDQVRRGHGRHLLSSLGKKLAILGPRTLLAEVPADRPDACAFFEACGFVRERTYADFLLVDPPRRIAGAGEAVPVGLDDVPDGAIAGVGAPCCWERSPETLQRRRERIRGIALGTSEGIGAFVLHVGAEEGSAAEIVALGSTDGEHGDALVGTLLSLLAAGGDRAVRLRKVAPAEIADERLGAWGFRREREYAGYSAAAEPA